MERRGLGPELCVLSQGGGKDMVGTDSRPRCKAGQVGRLQLHRERPCLLLMRVALVDGCAYHWILAHFLCVATAFLTLNHDRVGKRLERLPHWTRLPAEHLVRVPSGRHGWVELCRRWQHLDPDEAAHIPWSYCTPEAASQSARASRADTPGMRHSGREPRLPTELSSTTLVRPSRLCMRIALQIMKPR